MTAALALAAMAVAAPAAHVSGLHDARYCEVIELKGRPPSATATVWNTIGRNRCPEERWRALDAARIARARHDTLVVLNGPRHFLMDSAAAVTGGRHAFGGLGTTKVATLPIRTAADLVQAPYVDRTVHRRNHWSWRAGRTLFELVAPGGDVYVMQSYAQIVDPRLRLSALPRLGRRLALPPGWHYRTRRLRRPFVLDAGGSATIVQDELRDTYQLATPGPRSPRVSRRVDVTGHTRTVKLGPGGAVEDRGTVTGTPFGRGSIAISGTLANGRLTGTYRLTFRRGSVLGPLSLPYTVAGDRISFRGTTRFSGGTGAYRGIRSGALRVRDTNTLDGQHGVVTVTGKASYHR